MKLINFLDQAFYLNETEKRPLHIGALLELAPPRGFRGDLGKHVIDTMLARPVGPPFNYRLLNGPGGIPLGYDIDPDVDPGSQIQFHALPQPADRRALFDAVCAIHETHLDRSKPLWELHVFEGLTNGHIGLFIKVHHGLIDGLGFIERFKRVVSESPTDRGGHAFWEDFEAPAQARDKTDQHFASALAGHAIRAAIGVSGNLLGAGAMATRMLMRGAGTGSGMTIPFAHTPGTLKSRASRHRSFGHCVLELATAKRVAKAGGGKVNDVLLTALDMAVSRYASERGDPPQQPLVAIMPVALTTRDNAGNKLALLPVPLGRPDRPPGEKFRDIVRETGRVKHEVRSVPALALEMYSVLTHTTATVIEGLGLDELPMLGNMNVSNPYGLTRRVYYDGCPIELAIPFAPIGHHQTVNIIATTYADDLHVTFTAIREALPDIQRVADYTVAALRELESDLGGDEERMPGTRAKSPRKRTAAKRNASARPAASDRSPGKGVSAASAQMPDFKHRRIGPDATRLRRAERGPEHD